MGERIHALAQHLLDKTSLEECSQEELQHLAKRYPFFAPAQFLLLQKLKASNLPEAASQQRKAVLYYHDPLQFDYFLSEDTYELDDVLTEEKEPALEEDPNAFMASPDLAAEEINNIPEEVRTPEIQDSNSVAAPITETEEVSLTSAATVFPEPDLITEETVDPSSKPAMLPVAPLPDDLAAGPEANGENVLLTNQPVPETVVEEQQARPEVSTGTITEIGNTGTEDKPVSPAQAPSAAPSAGGDLLFEPYHTVDYFASQGIKVTADDQSKDKLSKQLRSFTEWLKVMKRLPAAEIAQSPQSRAEKSVENMASHSVEGSEVVTEAMAEVWAKQGAREKAIETYNKLSLLNPSKKAYFAAKIENLKGS